MTVQGPVKKQQPDGMSHRGHIPPHPPWTLPPYDMGPNHLEEEIVTSSAGADAMHPPFWGVVRIAYPKA